MPIYPAGGGRYSGPPEVTYLFVDGGYLRKVAEKLGKEFYGGAELPINYAALGSKFTKCFYYDCLPAPRTGEGPEASEERLSRQRAQLAHIQALRGWHVFEGVMAGSGSRTRQKQVDVQIAVDLLTHSYGKNMHRAAFIAGDQDFKPLVEAVVRDGMFIEIWFERSSASVDLLDAADARRPLDVYTIQPYLPNLFRDAHPLPRRWVEAGRNVGAAKLERTGECAAGNAELYRGGDEYMIVRPDQEVEGRFLYMTHPKLALLEQVSSSVDGEIAWQNGR